MKYTYFYEMIIVHSLDLYTALICTQPWFVRSMCFTVQTSTSAADRIPRDNGVVIAFLFFVFLFFFAHCLLLVLVIIVIVADFVLCRYWWMFDWSSHVPCQCCVHGYWWSIHMPVFGWLQWRWPDNWWNRLFRYTIPWFYSFTKCSWPLSCKWLGVSISHLRILARICREYVGYLFGDSMHNSIEGVLHGSQTSPNVVEVLLGLACCCHVAVR